MEPHLSARQSDPSVPTKLLYAHPWALHDPGIEAALDELASCGIDGVRLALNYHVADSLTPRSSVTKVSLGDLGSLSFRPKDVHEWPFEPPISSRVTSTTFASEVVSAANERGLRVGAWLVYCYSHALARSLPDLSVVDAFGRPSGAHLCPANPNVKAYVLALTKATLAQGVFDSLYAEALTFLPFDHGWLNRKAAVRPNEQLSGLMGLCFCAHCGETARSQGVDFERLRTVVRAVIEEALNGLPDEQGLSEAANDRLIEAGLELIEDVRSGVVTSAQRSVSELAKAAGMRYASNAVEVGGAGWSEQSRREMRVLVDETRVRLLPHDSLTELRDRVADVGGGAADSTTVVAFYQLGAFSSEAEFLSTVEAARRVGIQHDSFYEHSLLTRRQLEWITAARKL